MFSDAARAGKGQKGHDMRLLEKHPGNRTSGNTQVMLI
jgi:hypothetical protein